MSDEQPKTILIVANEDGIASALNDVLSSDKRFRADQATTFYEALDKIVTGDFALVLVENVLPDLTGLDLLTAVTQLVPELPVIIIDRKLSARAALAAFRLGAADYIAQPFQPDMVLMQVIRILHDGPRHTEMINRAVPEIPATALDQETYDIPLQDELKLSRDQVMAITRHLTQFQAQVRASFSGLLDCTGKTVAFAGSLKNDDMELVKNALTRDKAKRLAHVLSEQRFNANYLEGETYNVYMVEFGDQNKVSLVTICESSVKSGVVLFFAKQVAEEIHNIIQSGVSVPG